MDINQKKLESQLKRHEGLRLNPYHDTVGVLTIGYGRNLEEITITGEQAEIWLKEDIEAATRDLVRAFPLVLELSEVRQRVLINMTFNMGINRLKGFKKMWRALEQKHYLTATKEMANSKWHSQVGKRAEELESMMIVG